MYILYNTIIIIIIYIYIVLYHFSGVRPEPDPLSSRGESSPREGSPWIPSIIIIIIILIIISSSTSSNNSYIRIFMK